MKHSKLQVPKKSTRVSIVKVNQFVCVLSPFGFEGGMLNLMY